MRRHTREWAQYWAYPAEGVELLRAHYVEHRYDRHMHETFAFGLVERGYQTFSCRGARLHSSGGSIFAINPGDAHDGQAADTNGFLYRMIYVDPAKVREALGGEVDRAQIPLFRTPMFFDDEIANLLVAAHDRFTDESPKLERAHCLATFLRALASRHSTVDPVERRPPPAREALTRVREYMRARYSEDIALETLAAVAGLGRHHLTRAFTRAFGIAPHRYLTHLRLAAGRQQLHRGVAIADVSVAVGFSDQSHFHRRFKHTFGITPRQFQRAVTNVQ
jgi:AraC-like DNA-binding protein